MRERRPVPAPATKLELHSKRLRPESMVVPVVVAGAVCIGALLRDRYLRWGATAAERTHAFLGDELLPG